jgi:putative transposase
MTSCTAAGIPIPLWRLVPAANPRDPRWQGRTIRAETIVRAPSAAMARVVASRLDRQHRFPGFGYKSHGDGFRFTPGANWKHGTLRLSGVGLLPARGEARTPGRVVACSVLRKSDGWFLSPVLECAPHRERTDSKESGLDWGVESLATLASAPGAYDRIENDRLLERAQARLKDAQRALSAALRGKRSKRAAKARRLMAKLHRRLANRRKDRLHQVTAKLVREHALLVTEELSVANLTASAKGTTESPGRNVRQKAGLNRAILDTAPGSFLSLLAYKAKEAGTELILLDPRRHKPSQTCPGCGAVAKKSLAQRHHRCGACGFRASRDQAAALVLLAAGLKLAGREPAWVVRPETPARAA